jgi:hypothetical protein
MAFKPILCAVEIEQCKGFRLPTRARYKETSPSEMVLGMACSNTWLGEKSSKKFP